MFLFSLLIKIAYLCFESHTSVRELVFPITQNAQTNNLYFCAVCLNLFIKKTQVSNRVMNYRYHRRIIRIITCMLTLVFPI